MSASTLSTESVFVHIDNRWRQPGLATQVRKALVTLGCKNVHLDPSARLVSTVAKSMNIAVTEHVSDWTTRGGAIERTRKALSHTSAVLVITDDLRNDRYGANVIRQAVTANQLVYLLSMEGFEQLDTTDIPPFPYTEIDSTPFVVTDPRKLDPSLFVTPGDLA